MSTFQRDAVANGDSNDSNDAVSDLLVYLLTPDGETAH